MNGQHGGGKPTHQMSRTPIYMIWCAMLARCNNPNHPRYADYGGRGIKVCERWRHFELFIADMGERPPGHSLDRINNDAGYTPENCRWSTPAEQQQNRRRPVACRSGHRYEDGSYRVSRTTGKRICKECEQRNRQARKERERIAAVSS